MHAGIHHHLATLDERLAMSTRRSLSPDRETVTPLRILGERVATAGVSEEIAQAIVSGIAATAELMNAEFPHNIFWDLDLLTASMLKDARQAPSTRVAHARITEVTQLLRVVHEMFGRSSIIRFRYTHDFLYGYDWARWIARDPSQRGAIGPYDIEFLRHVVQRGQALTELIASGTHELYPALADDEFRNPFPFDRSSAVEIELHEGLAGDGLIPVQAWRFESRPDHSRDYDALRLDRARRSNIMKH